MANYDIGTLDSRLVSKNRFSVRPSDTTDVFEFDIFSRRNIGLNLHNISAGDDADLYLYRDSNNNDVFDSSDRLVASSRLSGNRNDVIDYLASPGTYFAQVRRYAPGSSGSVTYDLDLTATHDIGALSNTPVSRNNRRLSNNSNARAVYEFDVSGSRTINLRLHNISAGDDADLRLYRDSNNNGILDSADTRLATSSRGGNRDDLINYRASTGTYFAEVARYRTSRGGVNYDLDLSATSSRASNLVGEEYQVGNLSRDVLRSGSVNNSNSVDTYSFSLGLYEGTNISLSGLSSDADIRIIKDRNNNGIVDANEVIRSSTRSGSRSESITGINDSGNYFVQVYQFNGNTNYTLKFDHYTTRFA